MRFDTGKSGFLRTGGAGTCRHVSAKTRLQSFLTLTTVQPRRRHVSALSSEPVT